MNGLTMTPKQLRNCIVMARAGLAAKAEQADLAVLAEVALDVRSCEGFLVDMESKAQEQGSAQ